MAIKNKKMKTFRFRITIFVLVLIALTSCTTMHKSMAEPNTRVELRKTDFILSEQVKAESKTVRILGIDFERLFTKKSATISGGGSKSINLAKIPVVGGLAFDPTSNYALYELMVQNPGYDVIFYPQFVTKVSKPALGLGFLMKITTVEATARLGRLR